MAHVSILEDAVGAVAGANIVEGRLVTINASGIHNDLPEAKLAAANTTTGVFMIFAVPDQFPRPTPNGMFQYADTMRIPRGPDGATFHQYTHDDETAWLYGPSTLPRVTVLSGWKCALHRGGYYKLISGEYIDSAGIKVAGNKVKVGASGFVDYDSAGTYAIGYVREYLAFDGSITIGLREQ